MKGGSTRVAEQQCASQVPLRRVRGPCDDLLLTLFPLLLCNPCLAGPSPPYESPNAKRRSSMSPARHGASGLLRASYPRKPRGLLPWSYVPFLCNTSAPYLFPVKSLAYSSCRLGTGIFRAGRRLLSPHSYHPVEACMRMSETGGKRHSAEKC